MKKPKKKNFFWILVNVVFAWICFNMIVDTISARTDIGKQKERVNIIENEIVELKNQNEIYKFAVKNSDDINQVEKTAREVLRKKKKNERIFRIQPSTENNDN